MSKKKIATDSQRHREKETEKRCGTKSAYCMGRLAPTQHELITYRLRLLHPQNEVHLQSYSAQ